MALMVEDPYINFAPTLTGGIGRTNLTRFYREFFTPSMPPSMRTRLISRTVGVDKVIDEMYIAFKHTKEIPWLLPGVPPTNKDVEIVLVSVVTVRGGKLEHEHVYWDQASVLVQIGLLDPKLVPENMRSRGLQRLPVVGREAARKLLDEDAVTSNDLIPKWNPVQKKLPARPKGKAPVRNGSFSGPVNGNSKTQQANGAQTNAAANTKAVNTNTINTKAVNNKAANAKAANNKAANTNAVNANAVKANAANTNAASSTAANSNVVNNNGILANGVHTSGVQMIGAHKNSKNAAL
jgi:hypothetical protein